uniref:Uncharacterized protein n=1 Tax=Beauveria caledonica TaxID=38006 RepID=A0A192S1D8_9HYPO|nr:hypothetical protein [Beauveria caledonica]AMD61803.1 hypothetical protein [Beauveria caledonica]
MLLLNTSLYVNWQNLKTCAKLLNLQRLWMFTIYLDNQGISQSFSITDNIVNYTMSIDYFKIYLESIDNPMFWEKNEDSLYIIKNGSYKDLCKIFEEVKSTKVRLVKGGSQKRQFLSPMDERLSIYKLIFFSMNADLCILENTFNYLKKDEYLS